ncbi:hypothetical protein D3Z45_10900 [Lachnospiraceae bacterium]|nr:hypothetical protein [Lachnospiraceae bacterium]
MRYFEFVLKIKSEQNSEKAKIKLREYAYQNPVAEMEKLKNVYESVRGDKDFGNGRFVRKILEEAEMNLAERVGRK